MTTYIKVGLPKEAADQLQVEAKRAHRSVANFTGSVLLSHLAGDKTPSERPLAGDGTAS